MQNTNITAKSAYADPLVVDLHGRVSALEVRENERNTEIALIKNDLSYIKSGQDKLYAGLNRILWAIALSVLGAITTFIVSGGLTLN